MIGGLRGTCSDFHCNKLSCSAVHPIPSKASYGSCPILAFFIVLSKFGSFPCFHLFPCSPSIHGSVSVGLKTKIQKKHSQGIRSLLFSFNTNGNYDMQFLRAVSETAKR